MNNLNEDITETEEYKKFSELSINDFVAFVSNNSDEIIALANDLDLPFAHTMIDFNIDRNRGNQISVIHNIATYGKASLVALFCLYVVPKIRQYDLGEVKAYYEMANPYGDITKKSFYMKFIIEIIERHNIREKYPKLYYFLKYAKSKHSRLHHCLFALDPNYGLGYCKKCKTPTLFVGSQTGTAGCMSFKNCKFCGADLNDNIDYLTNKSPFVYDEFLQLQEDMLSETAISKRR